MKKDYSKLWVLFKSMFVLSACTFGGGFVIVSLMKKKFVEELQWLEEDEMLDVTAITQSAPGPLPVNASVIIGYRIAGVIGSLIPQRRGTVRQARPPISQRNGISWKAHTPSPPLRRPNKRYGAPN